MDRTAFINVPAAILMSMDTSEINCVENCNCSNEVLDFSEIIDFINAANNKFKHFIKYQDKFYKEFTEKEIPENELLILTVILPKTIHVINHMLEATKEIKDEHCIYPDDFEDNIIKVRDYFKGYYELSCLYLEIREGEKEIELGDTVTFEELFG